jgi:hypothetical protein
MESEAVELRSAAPEVAGEPPHDRHPGRARQLRRLDRQLPRAVGAVSLS